MKKEKKKKNKSNRSNIGVKIMAFILAGMMVLATVASLVYALIYYV